jgi:hypothetical protein
VDSKLPELSFELFSGRMFGVGSCCSTPLILVAPIWKTVLSAIVLVSCHPLERGGKKVTQHLEFQLGSAGTV